MYSQPKLQNLGIFDDGNGETFILKPEEIFIDDHHFSISILNPYTFYYTNLRDLKIYYTWDHLSKTYFSFDYVVKKYWKVSNTQIVPIKTKKIEKKKIQKRQESLLDVYKLCDDEWIHIFLFLTIKDLLLVTSFISKDFLRLSGETLQRLKFSDYINDGLDDKQVFYMIRCIPELEAINLSSCINITTESLKFLEFRSKTLKKLNIGYTRYFNLTKLAKLFDSCTLLEEIQVEHLEIDDNVLNSISKSKNLRLLCCFNSDITDDGLEFLSRSCPKLEILDIGMSKISSKGLIQLTKNCKLLKELTIDSNNKYQINDLIEFIKPCRNLVYLSMRETIISSDFIKVLASSCPLLKTLEIKYCTKNPKDNIKETLIKYLQKTKVNQ